MPLRTLIPFSARIGAYALIESDDAVMNAVLPKPITSDLMNIEPPLTSGSMQFDISLLAVTDPVAAMLPYPSAVDNGLESCVPAGALPA